MPGFRKKALENREEMVGCMWLGADVHLAMAKVKVRGILSTLSAVERSGEH